MGRGRPAHVPEPLGEWEPLSVEAVTDLLRGIDLGRQTRPHHDIECSCCARTCPVSASGCRVGSCTPPTPPRAGRLRPWPGDEQRPAALHDSWCRPTPASPWALQLMVDDTDGADWLYRRDHRIRRPVAGALDDRRRSWLREALTTVDPEHDRLASL